MVVAIALLGSGCQQVFTLEDPTLVSTAGVDAPRPDAPPSCTDKMLSPGESDVDCGGACSPCVVGDSCGQHADCATNVCRMNVCFLARSCLEIRDAGQLTSAVYSIDPVGNAPFDAYCEQTAAGGGWTLIMKLSSTGTALGFDAPYWTTLGTLNETALEPNASPQGSDAKLRAYDYVTGTQLRLQWLDPVHDFMYSPASPRTALQLFMGPEVLVVGNEGDACHGSLLDASPSFLSTRMRHATGPQFFGINGQDMEAGASDSYIRFGFASNDEPTNTWAPRQAAGTDAASLEWNGQTDCNNCGCYGSLYMPNVTSANLWIR